MPKPETVVFATPYTDQMYGAVTHCWNQITPRPLAWMGEISSYLPEAHNRLVERFLEHGVGDRLFIIEDDIEVDPHIVARLSGHRADVVTGIYRARRDPFPALLFDQVGETGAGRWIPEDSLRELIARPPREYPIEGCGTGLISIRRDVLESMPYPWFEPSPGNAEGSGHEKRGFGGHDLYFCVKLRRLGIGITVDTHPYMLGEHVGWHEVRV